MTTRRVLFAGIAPAPMSLIDPLSHQRSVPVAPCFWGKNGLLQVVIDRLLGQASAMVAVDRIDHGTRHKAY